MLAMNARYDPGALPTRQIRYIFRSTTMALNLSLTPIVSLLAGILILVVPRMLNYIVAIYLILVGMIGLSGAEGMHFR